MSSHPVAPTASFSSHIAALKREIETLPKEKTVAIQSLIDGLNASMVSEENAQYHLQLQERISTIQKLAQPLALSNNIEAIFQKLFQSECRAELFYYLKNRNEKVPEEARERLRDTVKNFDQKEEIDGIILALRLTLSSDPFLRGLLPVCLDQGADPTYVTRYGTSLMKYLIIYGDTDLIRDLAQRLNSESLKKVLLFQHKDNHQCALQEFSIAHTALLMEMMEKAQIPPDQELYDISLFLFYVNKAVNHYNAQQFLPFLDKYYHQLDADQLQKGLELSLSNTKTNAILRHLMIQGVRASSAEQKELFVERVMRMLQMDLRLSEEILCMNDQVSAEQLEKCCLSLILSGDLPLFLNTLTFTLDFLPKTAAIEAAISKIYPAEIVSALRSHFHLLDSIELELSDNRAPLDLIALGNKIAELRRVLDEPQFSQLPGFGHYKASIQSKLSFLEKELQEREAAVIQWIQNAEKKPSQQSMKTERSPIILSLNERRPISTHLKRDIHAYLAVHQKWHLMSELAKQDYDSSSELINKSVFHFLLDKAIYPNNKLHGGSPYRHGTDLMDSIELYLPLIDQDPTVPEEKKALLTKILKNFVQSIAITIKSEENPALLYQAFQAGVSPLIVYTGHQKHATLLALYQKGDHTTALLFNTGEGIINHHPVGPDQFRAQTFIGIDEIPTQTITREELLQFHAIQTTQTQIEPLYKHVEELAQRGKKRPPSSDPYLYEIAQESGTCSAQCWMASLRYHLCTELGGTPMENVALYKIVKRQLLKIMAEKRLSFLTEGVRTEAEERLKEISYQEQLWELCQSEAQLNLALDVVGGSLKKFGINPIVTDNETSIPAKSFALERNLRQLAKLLAETENAQHEELGLLTPLFELLVTKRSLRQKRYQSALQVARDKQDINELKTLMVVGGRSQFQRKAWLEQDYLKDPEFWNTLPQKEEDGKKLYRQARHLIPHLLTEE